LYGNDRFNRRIRFKKDRPKFGKISRPSIQLISARPFCSQIELPLWNERRLKLFIIGSYPLIRFPMKAVPTDPEEVYRALLRQTQGTGKGAKAVTRNYEAILREWENFISPFLFICTMLVWLIALVVVLLLR
jgi:hypothetical protein